MSLQHVAEWTPWMMDFMAATLGGTDSSVQYGRAPCSVQERALGQALHTQWAKWGYSVAYEAFSCAPLAFLGVIPVTVLCYFRAMNNYWDRPAVAAFAAALGLFLFVAELVRYHEVIDGLGFPFQLDNGINVVARMPPRGGKAPQRRLIVTAHQDSAFEFNLFWYFGPASPAVMAVVLTLMLLMPLATALHFVSGERVKRIRSRLYNVLVIGSVVVFACAFWHTGRVVPGAGDDLSGIAVMHAFAGEVAAAVSAEGSAQAAQYAYLGQLLDTTEIVVLATSGEEAGLRGAKRYCAKHAAELAALPTGVLVLESTHDVEHLSVIASEPWPGAYHDAGMVDLAVAAGVAAELPSPMRVVSLPLGGTDGVAFTRAGAAVAVLNAVDVSKLPPQYHTRLDTLDTVAPEALEAQLKVVLHAAAAFGRGEWRRASKKGLLQWVVTMLRSVTGSSDATAAEL